MVCPQLKNKCLHPVLSHSMLQHFPDTFNVMTFQHKKAESKRNSALRHKVKLKDYG